MYLTAENLTAEIYSIRTMKIRRTKKIISITLIAVVFFLLMRACMGDSHRFSSTYRLYETSLDGETWYTIESSRPNEMDDAPFCQYVDGVQQDGNLVYIWVNGTRHPDYYCIDIEKDTCVRINSIPAHIIFESPKQFLRRH